MLRLVNAALVLAAAVGHASRVIPNKSGNTLAAPLANVTKVPVKAPVEAPVTADGPRVRHFHRTAPEELLGSEMQRAIRDSAALSSDLKTAASVEKIVLQQADAGRVEKQHLEEQVVEDDKKLQAEAKIQGERNSLVAQVKKLSLALQQQVQETAQQQKISFSLSQKVKLLENDMRVMSKAWKEAAKHQVSIVSSLRPRYDINARIVEKMTADAAKTTMEAKAAMAKAMEAAKKAQKDLKKMNKVKVKPIVTNSAQPVATKPKLPPSGTTSHVAQVKEVATEQDDYADDDEAAEEEDDDEEESLSNADTDDNHGTDDPDGTI